MIRVSILFISIFLTLDCIAQDQDPKIDSLKSVLATQKDDSTKVNTLISIGTHYLSSDIDKAMNYGIQAQELAQNIDFVIGEAYALKLLGMGYNTSAKYPEADAKFKESLQLFESINFEDGIANILNNLGSNYFLMADDAKSIDYHLRSLRVSEKINNKLRIATNLTNIGTVYANKAATNNKSIGYFLRALKTFQEIEYERGIGVVSMNIGESYFKEQVYDSALTFFEIGIKIFEGDAYSAFGLSYVGEIYAEQKDFERAFKVHNEAIEITEKLGAKQDLAVSLISLASTLEKKGDHIESIETYRRAQKISEEIGALQEVKKTYEALSQAYARLGDFKNAYTYEALLTSIKETLYNTDEDKKIQALQFTFDIDKKENEINLLTKDKELQQATIQRQRIMNWAAGITGFLLLLMALGILNRYKYIKRTNKIIQNERDRSKELLLNILPEETAYELETNGHAQTRFYENVTVLFTDFKGFSTIAGKLSPQDLVAELNDYFMAFDDIVEKYDLEKIKTIGDAYMCAGGIPVVNETHALNAVEAALAMQEYMKKKIDERAAKGEQGWELRIGIHTGPIVAGVVGKMKYAYDIWGDTVNVASRMESNGEAGKVNISSATFNQIKDNYACLHRGKISAKNIGEVDMYFIENEIISQPVEIDNAEV